MCLLLCSMVISFSVGNLQLFIVASYYVPGLICLSLSPFHVYYLMSGINYTLIWVYERA